MKTYIDKDFLIAKDTLISYTGTEKIVDVPQNLGSIHLTTIGDDAFAESGETEHISLPCTVERIGYAAFRDNAKLKSIKLPGTVKHFGQLSFWGCNQLSEIIIYDIRLDDNTYQRLKGDSLRTFDSIYVSKHIPDFIADTGINNSGIKCAATAIPNNVPILFKYDSDSLGQKEDELFDNVDHMVFSLDNDLYTENSSFINQMKNNNFASVSKIAETRNDLAVKSDRLLIKEKTFIFTFDDTLTQIKDGEVLITAKIKLGYFFWQSGQRIICNKRDYYVYRRFYLSSNSDLEYVKEDVAIYKGTEILKNRKEAQQVYGKYKLLSIL